MQVSFIWQREGFICLCPHEPKSAVNVFVFAPSVHNLSLLTPCNLRGIDRQRGDWLSITTKRRHGKETHTESDKNKQKLPIPLTILPIPLRIPPCENYQSTPSLPPLSCVHKCLIWISLAPLPSNCPGPRPGRHNPWCADAQRTPGESNTSREIVLRGPRSERAARNNGYEKIVEQTLRVVNPNSVWSSIFNWCRNSENGERLRAIWGNQLR